MSLTFPDWWDGGFPDVELVARMMLLPWVGLIDPSPDVVAWLPDKYDRSLPIISVARMPGESTPDVLEDIPQVLVTCICETRSQSWELSEFVRQMLLAYSRGTSRIDLPDGQTALVTGVEETEGPMLSPLSDFDERITTASYLISTKRNNTDYVRVRKTL